MKIDRRVKYTQKVLKESLIEILKEHPIERVTVKEICDRADVNRSTFYVHYGSPQELLDSVIKEMYEEIREKKKDYADLKSYMLDICDIMYENRELVKMLVKAGNVESMLKVASLWKDDFIEMARMHGDRTAESDASYLFICSGALTLITTWLLGELPMTRDEIVERVYALTTNGLRIYSEEE